MAAETSDTTTRDLEFSSILYNLKIIRLEKPYPDFEHLGVYGLMSNARDNEGTASYHQLKQAQLKSISDLRWMANEERRGLIIEGERREPKNEEYMSFPEATRRWFEEEYRNLLEIYRDFSELEIPLIIEFPLHFEIISHRNLKTEIINFFKGKLKAKHENLMSLVHRVWENPNLFIFTFGRTVKEKLEE